MARIAPRIHRIGPDDIVNAYLIEDAGAITIVDAGVPAFWGVLPAELGAMGRSIADVRAVVLTHGHTDHLGFAESARRAGLDVRVSEADAALARGEVPNPAKGIGPFRLVPLLGFLWWTARHGGLRLPRLLSVATFGGAATLDVPGALRVIAVPGHTPGSVAFHAPGHDTLFAGDALATYAVTTGRRGPLLAPFTADAAQAVDSLRRIEAVPASLVLPGHGPAWTDGVAMAVERVRESVAR